jgi:hypothetical protein
MNMYGGVEVWIHIFSAMALDGGELSASLLSYFIHVEKVHPGDRVGPSADIDTVEKRKIS